MLYDMLYGRSDIQDFQDFRDFQDFQDFHFNISRFKISIYLRFPTSQDFNIFKMFNISRFKMLYKRLACYMICYIKGTPGEMNDNFLFIIVFSSLRDHRRQPPSEAVCSKQLFCSRGSPPSTLAKHRKA